MSGKNHNKKRNSMLLYEFLVQTISKSLIEDDKKKSGLALKILRKHYKPGTSLHKEFRLINSLVKTTVSSEHVAASILKEAKNAAMGLDYPQLDREKSHLIRNINHAINDENFYDQHVNEYRICATIQTLFNEWKSPNKDLAKIAQYEDQVMKWLTTEKEKLPEQTISEDSSGSARLLMKVMAKKLNEKYSEVLNEQQRSIVRAYAFSTASEDQTSIRMKLFEMKDELLSLIKQYRDEEHHNEYIKNKLSEAERCLVSENLEVVDDAAVTRFMLYSRLRDELESKE
jgi:hypothetical protein